MCAFTFSCLLPQGCGRKDRRSWAMPEQQTRADTRLRASVIPCANSAQLVNPVVDSRSKRVAVYLCICFCFQWMMVGPGTGLQNGRPMRVPSEGSNEVQAWRWGFRGIDRDRFSRMSSDGVKVCVYFSSDRIGRHRTDPSPIDGPSFLGSWKLKILTGSGERFIFYSLILRIDPFCRFFEYESAVSIPTSFFLGIQVSSNLWQSAKCTCFSH